MPLTELPSICIVLTVPWALLTHQVTWWSYCNAGSKMKPRYLHFNNAFIVMGPREPMIVTSESSPP